MGKSELVLYQPDSTIAVEVRLEEENVWQNRQQISVLFDSFYIPIEQNGYLLPV